MLIKSMPSGVTLLVAAAAFMVTASYIKRLFYVTVCACLCGLLTPS